ncbi:MAG: hypothetical protein PQ964_00270 [Methanobacteriaceae archaeon]|jgi:HD-GYP domain-containing protein (c-di-GMP phosphodiesterase class II)
MTYKIPYKEAFCHKKALNEIKKGSGTRFDPYLVEKFVEMMEEPSKTL